MKLRSRGASTAMRIITPVACCVACATPVLGQDRPVGEDIRRTDESRTEDAIDAPEAATATDAGPPDGTAANADGIVTAMQVNAGIYLNPRPSGGRNFGHLFMDHANEPQLNQILLTASKAAKPQRGGSAFGFNIQALYGSDARLAVIAGINDDWIDARSQIAVTQANVVAHLPWLTAGGTEIKAGILTGSMGLESFDPSGRPFYSYSYLSNYLLPFQHVGIVATVHLSDKVGVFAQVDGGNAVSIGKGDPNHSPAGYLGVAISKLANGTLTVLAAARVGPENPSRLFPRASSRLKYWNDLSVLYDPSEHLALRVEVNYQYDEALRARGYALMGFATYKPRRSVSFSARGELYRDDTGLLTVLLLEDQGYARSLVGAPTRVVTAPPATYASLTAGMTIRPEALQRQAAVSIRPEIRYDRSLSATRPFNDMRDRGAVMIGADLIVGF